MFNMFEKIDAGKERHERLLAEAEQYRRFHQRGVTESPLREVVHRMLMASANLLIALGTRLKAKQPTSGDMPAREAIGSSHIAH
jgi:hypothetical protein